MTQIEETLLAIAKALETAAVPYMVVGGVANLFWGVPRTTLDVDITVWAEEAQITPLIQRLGEVFRLLPDEPAEFVGETRVLPMETKQGFRRERHPPGAADVRGGEEGAHLRSRGSYRRRGCLERFEAGARTGPM